MIPDWLREHARYLLISASFFNVSLIPMWKRREFQYTNWLPYDEIFLFVIVAAVCLYLIALLFRNHWESQSGIVIGLTAFLLLPMDGLRTAVVFSGFASGEIAGVWVNSGQLSLIALLLILVIYLLALHSPVMTRSICMGFLLITSPLLLFSGYLGVTHWQMRQLQQYESAPVRVSGATTPRFQADLLLLDEADYQLIYAQRPEEVQLPAFDRLAKNCMHFTEAYSAGGDTLNSVPAMLLGRPVPSFRYNHWSLAVRPEDSELLPDWRSENHLLNTLQQKGLNVGVIGVYHSYCTNDDYRYRFCKQDLMGLGPRMYMQFFPLPLAIYQDNALVKWFFRYFLTRHTAEYKQRIRDYRHSLQQDQLNLARRARESTDFLYLHVGIPHPPSMTKEASPGLAITNYGTTRKQGYFANLAATDDLLAETLIWPHADGDQPESQRALIVTSDHALRLHMRKEKDDDLTSFGNLVDRPEKQETHVPLHICLPGEHAPEPYTAAVSLLDLRGLIEGMFEGTISSYQEIGNYFMQRPLAGRIQGRGIDEKDHASRYND